MINNEFFKAFRHIEFKEDGHEYLDLNTGGKLTSVTSLYGKLKPKFDERYWLAYKTFERNGYSVQYIDDFYFLVDGSKFTPLFDSIDSYNLEFTIQDMKQEWNLAAKLGQTRGTILHQYMENLWDRKEIKTNIPEFVMRLDTLEAIRYIKSIEILKKLGKEFYATLSETHSPVLMEYVVGDSEFKIAGQFDALLYNRQTEQYEIWDYKTDKKFRTSGKDFVKEFYIKDCELSKYSIQLGIYKYLIERHTGIKIDKCNIAHFDYKKETVNVIETIDYSENINSFFNGNNRSTYL